MATILRRRLDRDDRLKLAASSIMSLPADTAEQLARAVLIDIRRWRHGPVAAERERMLADWRKHCGDPTRRARR